MFFLFPAQAINSWIWAGGLLSSSSKATEDFSQLKAAAIILLKVWIAVLIEAGMYGHGWLQHFQMKLWDKSLQMFSDQFHLKGHKMGVNTYVCCLSFLFQTGPLSPICSCLMVSSSGGVFHVVSLQSHPEIRCTTQSYLQTDNLIWTVALPQWILFVYCRGLWPALCFEQCKVILLWILNTLQWISARVSINW